MLAAVMTAVSHWAIPTLLLFIPLLGYWRGVKVYEAFVEGAAEGFTTAVRIIPYLVAMMVALNVFRVSGAMDFCTAAGANVLAFFHIPPELVPLAVMRPLSGSGALGLASELLRTYGPDSFVGRVASTLMGSTDTTFYVLTVYFGAVGVYRVRYAMFVGLLGDLAGFIGSIYICQKFFGY